MSRYENSGVQLQKLGTGVKGVFKTRVDNFKKVETQRSRETLGSEADKTEFKIQVYSGRGLGARVYTHNVQGGFCI